MTLRRHTDMSVKVLVEPVFSCVWAVDRSPVDWIAVQLPAPGTVGRGDGGVVFTVSPNASTQSRQAVLIVGEAPLTIVQEGRR